MTRQIKVTSRWQGNKQVPGINLQGFYLKEFGFEPGERVKIEFKTDEITIKKLDASDILDVLRNQNPSMEQLIKEFGLVLTG